MFRLERKDEKMFKAGLVLEGGGLRGVFTAGVLDCFMENDIEFENIIGVSAGAIHATSYLSKQKGRAMKATVDHVGKKEYCSFSNVIKTGNLFETNYAYNLIPNKFNPFDYEAYRNSKMKLYATVTDVISGDADYIELSDLENQMDALRASASLPLVSEIVEYNGKKYLDGGMSDSIPIKKSISMGYEKNVIVLTQPDGYEKSADKNGLLMKLLYRKYPGIVKAMKNRHIMYNDTLSYIKALEKEGRVFVIRPSQPLVAGRIEKDRKKLEDVYDTGYKIAYDCFSDMLEYLSDV